MMLMERRTHLRAPVSLVGALASNECESPVVVLDLSPFGARIQTEDPPQAGYEYLLDFSVHRSHYQARFRVTHWAERDRAFQWGGAFLDLPSEQLAELRRAVQAAAGLSGTIVRPWAQVFEQACRCPDEQILVGFTPAGREIHLSGADCLDIEADGVELFVRTVAGLENT